MTGEQRVAAVVDFDKIIIQFGLKLAEGESAVKRRRCRLKIEYEGARHVVQVARRRQIDAGAINHWSGVWNVAANRATIHDG